MIQMLLTILGISVVGMIIAGIVYLIQYPKNKQRTLREQQRQKQKEYKEIIKAEQLTRKSIHKVLIQYVMKEMFTSSYGARIIINRMTHGDYAFLENSYLLSQQIRQK